MSELSDKIAQLRQNYSAEPLTKGKVDSSPFKQFENWFNEALSAELLEPNAMTLATASKEGIFRLIIQANNLSLAISIG